MRDLADVFFRIYSEHQWGWPSSPRKNEQFYSGGGTELENDKNGQYVKLVQEFVNKPDVKTVIEIGCGDWEVSSRIDWSRVAYRGYDVVPEVVEYNRHQYGCANIKFECRDVFYCDPAEMAMVDAPVSADLLIVKDVFQHLPPSMCVDFVRAIPSRFKYNLITNDLGGNTEIKPGEHSGNDFSQKPFCMRSELLLQWIQSPAAGNKQTVTLFAMV